MATTLHDEAPRPSILDQLRHVPRTILALGGVAAISLGVMSANALKSDASNPPTHDSVPTVPVNPVKSQIGAGDRQELTAATTTEPAPVTIAKAAVANPKPETKPTQTTTGEREQSAFEKAAALGRASTVQFGFHDKSVNNTDYETAAQDGTATHIGGGWIIFNKHQLNNGGLGADGPKQGGPYDAASSFPYKFTAWNGSGPGQMNKAGELKGIIVNGDNNQPDFALGYAPDAANMPSMKLAKQAPNTAGEYFITGYPSAAHGEQKQYPAKFLAEGNVGDIRYKGDPYPTDNNIRLYYFGIDKSVPNAEDACTGGFSGGGVGNTAGEVYGGLTAYGKPGAEGKSADPVWYGANMHNSAGTENMQVVCAIQVVDQAMVDSYQAKLGQPTP